MGSQPKLSYQEAYYRKKHDYMDIHNTNYINNLVKKIISCGEIKKHHKILEIGCGKGRFSIPILKKGYSLTCIDLSENLLREFKKNISTNMEVRIIKGDFNKMTSKFRGRFDFIIGFYILHHLGNLENSFNNMKIMLKKGGRIIFSENNPYNLMYYLQMLLIKDITWEGEKGILNMRRRVILPILKKLDLENANIKRYGFFPPVIVNTHIGYKLDKILEKIRIFHPFLPFQIITAKKPK